MKSTEEIIAPYKRALEKANYKKINNGNLNPDVYLFQKWAYRIPKGWYGFSLGNVPFVWAQIIDDFLTELEKECPDFEIHQIKLKFGGLRFYVNLGEEINSNPRLGNYINGQIAILEEILFSKNLIY